MFALIFEFPTNRYQATLWQPLIDEAIVPWPPEPWQILHALVSSYKYEGNSTDQQKGNLDTLISYLVENLPSYRLPKAVAHKCTNNYASPREKKENLISNAFLQLPKGERLVAVWPELELNPKLFKFVSRLAKRIVYLDRAENWAKCTATNKWKPKKNDLMCHPVVGEIEKINRNAVVKVIAPLSANDYATERSRLIAEFEKRLRDEAEVSKKNPPTDKTLEKKKNRKFGPTLPKLLTDALSLDTGDYLKYGWNLPPASREVMYFVPEVSSSSSTTQHHYAGRHLNGKNQDSYTVARYLLAGRPLPRIEDAIKIGELMRLAALSKFGWKTVESTRDKKPKAPPVISGRDTDGKPLRDSSHSHAFWLPEDADGDGWIDHITVYAPEGLDTNVRIKLDRLTRLWINENPRDDEGSGDSSSLEWRLALEGFGRPEDFSDSSRILGTGKVWVSLTPFLATGHLKSQGYSGEIKRLLKRRKIVPENLADHVQIEILPDIKIGGAVRHTTHFHRFRSRGQEKQTDTHGTFLRLSFPEPISGPLSLGYACHFGLGLFALESF